MRTACIVLAALAVGGSTPSGKTTLEWSGPPGSSKPFLSRTSKGDLMLSWFEPRADRRYALRAANRSAGAWSPPVTIAESDKFFVNWADFPSITETTTGTWVVHWLEKTATKAYAYHVKLAASRDRGRTWSAPVTVHSDSSATEHGFVAMVPLSSGSVAVAWLDGRQMTDSAGAMSVRTALWNPDGTVSDEAALDTRTCECCQVSMTAGRGGLVVAYRDRSEQEIRDIAVVRQDEAGWSEPVKVANDGWVSRQCPVNGPSIAASGSDVGVAWFTAANGVPKVNAAFSTDGGRTFGKPIRIDEGNPLGRIHFQMTSPGRGVVTWLEADGNQAFWRVRSVGGAGADREILTVATTSRSRDGGFPRTALVGSDLYVAYAEPAPSGSEPGRVRVTKVSLVK